MTRNLFGDFLLRRLLTDFRGCDLSGRCRYPLRVENVPQISQIYTDFSWDVFFVTQISQMTQIFFSWDFFHRMPRNLFGDFLLRRLLTDFRGCDLSGRCRYPLRLEKVPQISQIYTDFFIGVFSPTDFTDIHRFFLGRFFVTQISQMTQIFFSWDFFHRMPRNLFGDFLLRRLLTDFRGCDLYGRCRYPLRLEKVPQISQIYTDFSWDVFLSRRFRR